jgi:predicted  nucleic acid-binding Zn-ribbon protein
MLTFCKLLFQDDKAMLESEIMLSKNKVSNLERSNQPLHGELQKLREELKAESAAKKTAEDALAAIEAKHQ